MDFIAYFCVSTDRQGRSGLELEAQRSTVTGYVAGRGEIVDEFTEIESGRKVDRPQLQAALDLAARRNATLVIARLDRLARHRHPIGGSTGRRGIAAYRCRQSRSPGGQSPPWRHRAPERPRAIGSAGSTGSIAPTPLFRSTRSSGADSHRRTVRIRHGTDLLWRRLQGRCRPPGWMGGRMAGTNGGALAVRPSLTFSRLLKKSVRLSRREASLSVFWRQLQP